MTITTMEELEAVEVGHRLTVRGSTKEYERVKDGWKVDDTVLGSHLFHGLVNQGRVTMTDPPVAQQLEAAKKELAEVRAALAAIVARIPE